MPTVTDLLHISNYSQRHTIHLLHTYDLQLCIKVCIIPSTVFRYHHKLRVLWCRDQDVKKMPIKYVSGKSHMRDRNKAVIKSQYCLINNGLHKQIVYTEDMFLLLAGYICLWLLAQR